MVFFNWQEQFDLQNVISSYDGYDDKISHLETNFDEGTWSTVLGSLLGAYQPQ